VRKQFKPLQPIREAPIWESANSGYLTRKEKPDSHLSSFARLKTKKEKLIKITKNEEQT
jgi:hypothetical protein